MEEFKTYLMEDLIEEIAMGPFGSNIKVDCFVDSGVPVLNGANLQGYKLREDSFKYVTRDKADSLNKANAYRGDIVITHRGTLGQIVYIPNDSKYDRYVISQSQFRVRVNPKVALPEYVVFFFHTQIGQHRLLANASQVGVPAIARPSTTFKKVEIELPSIKEQERIVAILNSLSDKIELNNCINHNLLDIAQGLFDNQIVENANYQENWSKSSLLDIAEYLNGLAMQKYPIINGEFGLPVLKIKELGQQACDESSDKCTASIPKQFIVEDGDVIFSWSGTLLVDYWCGGKCGLNQHLFKVSSNKYPSWFVYFWTKHHLDRFIRIAKDKAVTMGHIKRGDLENAEAIIPDASYLNTLDNEIRPLVTEYIGRRIENRKLQMLRDSILPELMAGHLAY